MNSDKLRIIYIAGDNHCGSTIVGRILGQLEGFFMAGEVRELWNRGVKDNIACSCGQPMMDCEVWGKVIAESSPEPMPDAQAMIALQWESTRSRRLGLLLPWKKSQLAERWRTLIGYSAKLYQTIANVTGCSVIVDTSKAPIYGYMLGLVQEIDLAVVHLVRDPRGSAYSWYQRRHSSAAKKGTVHRGRPSEAAISLRWAVLNLLSDRLCAAYPDRSMLLRYEDFLKNAQGSIERIAALARRPVPVRTVVDNNTVDLPHGHIGLGNPSRTEAGRVALRRDDRWVTEMADVDKALITVMTLPWIVTYGYMGE